MAMLSSQMVFILDISIVDFLWSLVDISICYYTICYSIHGRYCLRLRSGVGHQPYPATNRCNELAGYISPLMAESMTPGCPKRSFHQRRSKCTWRLQWSFEMSTAMVFEGSSMGIPYKAIFWGDIPLHRPYLGLTYGIGTSKFHRFLLHGHWDHRTMITGFQEFQWGCRESVLKSGSSYMSPIFCGVSRAKSHGKLGIGNCLEVIMENWGNIIDHLWWNSTFWASKMKMGPRQKQGESSVVGAKPSPNACARHVGSTSHAVWNMKTLFETTHGSSCTPVDAHLYQSNGKAVPSTPSPSCAPDRSWSMVGACLEGMPEQTQHKPDRICNFKMWEITIVLTIHFGATNLTQTHTLRLGVTEDPKGHLETRKIVPWANKLPMCALNPAFFGQQARNCWVCCFWIRKSTIFLSNIPMGSITPLPRCRECNHRQGKAILSAGPLYLGKCCPSRKLAETTISKCRDLSCTTVMGMY